LPPVVVAVAQCMNCHHVGRVFAEEFVRKKKCSQRSEPLETECAPPENETLLKQYERIMHWNETSRPRNTSHICTRCTQ
jgi:hypothetical protein